MNREVKFCRGEGSFGVGGHRVDVNKELKFL